MSQFLDFVSALWDINKIVFFMLGFFLFFLLHSIKLSNYLSAQHQVFVSPPAYQEANLFFQLQIFRSSSDSRTIYKQPSNKLDESMSSRAHSHSGSRSGSRSRQPSHHGHGSERGSVREWLSTLGSTADRQPAQRPPRRPRGPPPAAYDNRRRDIPSEQGYVQSEIPSSLSSSFLATVEHDSSRHGLLSSYNILTYKRKKIFWLTVLLLVMAQQGMNREGEVGAAHHQELAHELHP